LDGLTFDSSHDLWMSFCNGQDESGYLIELTAAGLRSLVTTGNASFKIVIEDPSTTGRPNFLACPGALEFDPSGNLWAEVTDGQAPELLEYAKNQLTASKQLVSPTPTAEIVTPAEQTNFEPVLAFDKDGNLWLSGGVISGGSPQAEQDTVVEYPTAQLADGTQADPNQTLIVADTSVSGALHAPSSITFDASGNLWVAFALGGTGGAGGVEEFSAAALTGSGTSTPSPTVTLDPAAFTWGKIELQSFATPDGLAFDNAGDLWVANQSQLSSKLGPGSLVEFTPSELTASGSPVPTRGILANKHETNLGAPINIAFGPALP
jgi:secreted PhoX family phosphatase